MLLTAAAATILILRDPRGKEVGRSTVPVRAQQPAPGHPPQPQDFHFPQVAVAGQQAPRSRLLDDAFGRRRLRRNARCKRERDGKQKDFHEHSFL